MSDRARRVYAELVRNAQELAMFNEIGAAFASMPDGMSGPFDGCQPVGLLDSSKDDQPAE
jgi:hypothetical protein